MGKKQSPSPVKGGKKVQQKPRFGSGSLEFVKSVRSELKKVSWPNRDQLQQSTIVVLVIVVVLGAYIAFWDLIFQALARVIFL